MLGAGIMASQNPPQQTIVQNDNKDVVSAIDKMANKLKETTLLSIQ